MKKLFSYLISILLIIVVACNTTEENNHQKRFTRLKSESSGINFLNKLTENDSINYFTYPYIYMGGGVAIGDINNDNLPDIYFTGNMVENKLYLNKGNLKFEDITHSAGLAGDGRWYSGITMVDINADNLLDIYLCVSGKGGNKENELYINNGDLTFTESAAAYGLNDPGQSVQSAFFDYDKDGDLDVYLANYPITSFKTSNIAYRFMIDENEPSKSDKLYRNDGNGHFEDVTKASGLLNFGLSLSATVADYNNDGWDDVYISNDFSTPDYFYVNNGDGTFTEKLKSTTKQTSFYSMGADAADYNNDGLIDLVQLDMAAEVNRRVKANMASMNPDLFWSTVNNGFHYQYMYNSLQLNRGINEDNLPIFSNVAWLTGISSTDWSWAPLMADFDNDGWKDLYITNGTRREINNRDFFKETEKIIKKDTPSDTLLKLVMNMPSEAIDNYIFKNKGDLTFEKMNESWGLEYKGFSNGAAYGDLDNDGDLDLAINNIDDLGIIFENKTNTFDNSHYLKINFQSEGKNIRSIGTKIIVISGENKQWLHLNPSRGFQSFVEPMIHVGLGSHTLIDSLIIQWPDGKESLFTKVEADQTITIKPGDGDFFNVKKPTPIPLFTAAKDIMDTVFWHWEEGFNDYDIQVLLPHKMSTFGPGLAVGDINGDGLDDFYIGHSSQSPGAVYMQLNNGTFEKTSGSWQNDSIYEDLGAELIDFDNDNDLDLYVVSGGNEYQPDDMHYQDRIYINNNGVLTKAKDALPDIKASGSRIVAHDIDDDGDVDLFIGGRHNPHDYPNPGQSYLLINQFSESGKLLFKDETNMLAPELSRIGMVTDALWTDFDGNGTDDLVVVGEWMPITVFSQEEGKFVNRTNEFGYGQSNAWWFSIDGADFDNDGDIDLVAGNLGLNYKYQATEKETFDIYYYDFDQNGSDDIVLGYYNFGEQYPVRGRQCSSQQISAIQIKFEDYESFAEATIEDIYGTVDLEKSLHYKVSSFASVYLQNEGNGKYIRKPLPNIAQIAPINDMIINDYDQDGQLDIIVGGNLYASEVETPRADASIGLLLKGNGKGEFSPVPYNQSGINMGYDVKNIKEINVGGVRSFIVANNKGPVQIFKNTQEDLDTVAGID